MTIAIELPADNPGFASTVWEFIKEVAETAKNKIVSFVKGTWEHLESVTILSLATIGLNYLLEELPFFVMLPAWIESPMIIPVLSVLAIAGLVKLAEIRGKRKSKAYAIA